MKSPSIQNPSPWSTWLRGESTVHGKKGKKKKKVRLIFFYPMVLALKKVENRFDLSLVGHLYHSTSNCNQSSYGKLTSISSRCNPSTTQPAQLPQEPSLFQLLTLKEYCTTYPRHVCFMVHSQEKYAMPLLCHCYATALIGPDWKMSNIQRPLGTKNMNPFLFFSTQKWGLTRPFA